MNDCRCKKIFCYANNIVLFLLIAALVAGCCMCVKWRGLVM